MPAVALTDHGNMFGAIEFYNTAQGRGHQADRRHGSLRGPGRPARPHARQGEQQPSRAPREERDRLPEPPEAHLDRLPRGVLLQAADRQGAAAQAQRRAHLPLRLPQGRDQREDRRTTARREAEAAAREFLEIFGEGNFYLEMQDHGIPEQRLANDVVRRISRSTGIPLVVSNDCHYLTQGRRLRPRHPALHRHPEEPLRPRPAALLLRQLLHEVARTRCTRSSPTTTRRIENTLAIAERCDLVIPTGTFHLPEFPVPEGYTLQSYFEKVVREGLEERLAELRRRRAQGLVQPARRSTAQRLEYEIQVIEKMGFPGYFLVVWDFIRYARENDVPVGPGRGSAAGSLVAYSLRITDIDPLQYDLLFERFLNPDRISMPDIDIDFCMRAAGRGHPLRRREVRPRPGGPDHHLRNARRQGGHPRRRPRPGAALHQGGPRRQADPRHDQVARGRGQGQRRPRRRDEGPRGQAGHRGRPAARRADPPRLGPRRRRRHHAAPRSTSWSRSTRSPRATKSRS